LLFCGHFVRTTASTYFVLRAVYQILFISESLLEDSVSLFGDLSSSSETQDMNLRESGLDTDTFACNGKNKINQSMFLYILLLVFECVFRGPRFGTTDRYLVVLMKMKI
jgi:hypothetical protein